MLLLFIDIVTCCCSWLARLWGMLRRSSDSLNWWFWRCSADTRKQTTSQPHQTSGRYFLLPELSAAIVFYCCYVSMYAEGYVDCYWLLIVATVVLLLIDCYYLYYPSLYHEGYDGESRCRWRHGPYCYSNSSAQQVNSTIASWHLCIGFRIF